MNSLPGKITDISSEGGISLIKIDVQNTEFKSIVVETPQTSGYLKRGRHIKLLFKETEVIIAHPEVHHLSLQNKMLCEILSINNGKLLSELLLAFGEFRITAIITSHAVDQLDLQTGNEVLAFVKTNEVMLSPE